MKMLYILYKMEFFDALHDCVLFGELHAGYLQEYSSEWYSNKKFFKKLSLLLLREAKIEYNYQYGLIFLYKRNIYIKEMKKCIDNFIVAVENYLCSL